MFTVCIVIPGATLSWTQELTATLHIVINMIKAHLGIDSVRLLDVPCGDMAWMSMYYTANNNLLILQIQLEDTIHSKTLGNYGLHNRLFHAFV